MQSTLEIDLPKTEEEQTIDLNFDRLSLDQQLAIKEFNSGKNILITGPAGTGKSYLLNYLRKQDKLPVTATTGIAAVNVEGQTIHSWAGLGLCDKPAKKIAHKIIDDKKKPYFNITNATQLTIDEISMLSAGVFDTLNEVFQYVKGNKEPFGGIQLVLFGDFLQLPPVAKNQKVQFAFESDAWQQAAIETIILDTIHRQNEQKFIEALNEMRKGKCSEIVSEILNSRYRQKDENPNIQPVILHPKNMDVDQENEKQLAWLPGELKTFHSKSSSIEGHFNSEQTLIKNCLAPETLNLKEGAQVMLLTNLNVLENLVNGSLGVVKEFNSHDEPLVEFDGKTEKQKILIERNTWSIKNDSDEVVAWYQQLPLKLAYSITMHKTQGMSLDKIKIYLNDCFAPGQAYVAVSRAKTVDGLFIESGNPSCINASEQALQFYGYTD